MTATRLKAAEEWADGLGPIARGLAIDAHIAGQECGEEREREAVVRWLKERSTMNGGTLKNEFWLAEDIERGEHREEKKS